MSASSNKAITKPPPGLPPLPLSQTENGALATAPLSTVINSATDALYLDLYNLVHGEIKIVSVAANATGGAADGGGGDGGGGAASSGVASGGGGQENAASSVEEKLTAAALGVNNEPTGAPAPSASTNPNDALLETRKAKMANLSFAQRRHELTRRVVQHTKSLAHAYALTAASLPKSHSSILQQKALKSHSISSSGGGAKVHDPPPRLGATVQVSSDALQFVKSGWVSQDEAQDALYFHHDGLWKARAHCHDVLGALCVLSTPMSGEMSKKESDSSSNGVKKEEEDADADAMQVDNETSSSKEVTLNNYIGTGGGRWPDFPTDVALAVDRYETSKEKAYSTPELQARLASAVRRKLVLGEVGAYGTLASRGGSSGETTAPAKTITPNNGKDSLGKRRDDGQPLPWRVVLGKGGGSIRLTYGMPRTVSTAEALRQRTLAEGADDDIDQSNSDLQQYPMEARLSVLSESPSAPWKLLSVHVRCSPKTGESDHQLFLNKKQMFDLHRIGERCMIVEEAICRKANEELKEKQKNKDGTSASLLPSPIVPRPLHRLFEVTHAFALSMQMEILSSQAEALRRGAWGGSVANTNGRVTARRDASVECITVSPAFFFDKKSADSEWAGKDAPITVMAVHFWSCDDRYGSPKVGDLSTTANKNTKNNEKDDESMISSKATSNRTNQQKDDNYLPKLDRRGEKRLSLCIRAVPTVGLVVSLSGGSDMGTVDNQKDGSASTQAINHHMQRNVDKLLSSIQDPFQLSMSDALLAATVLCADRRCRAMVGALNRQKTGGLPSWIQLEVECGTISVAAIISYPTTAPATTDSSQQSSTSSEKRSPTVLFRLACDSRTGRFVPVFPRPASLLRLLACNDPSASDIQTLRGAALASAVGARLGSNNGGNIAKRTEGASRESTGRIVRDAFEALARSTDTLGRKCGVGGDWNDVHGQQSTSLREKSVDSTCHDVKASLMTCCGMASVFGVAAIALKIAGGVDSVADMAGGPIVDAKSNNTDLLRVPPLSIPLRQRIVEKLVREGDGEIKRLPQLQGELFSVSAKVNNETLELVCFDVLTILESASSVPLRLEYAEVTPPESDKIMWATTESSDNMPRPQKRARIATVGMGSESSSRCHHTLEEVEHATLWLDTLLQQQ